jgi:hypothetical protein
MTVTAQTGIFGYGTQSAKTVAATTLFKHLATDINYGPVQDLRTFPLEVGGIITPTGGYKGGVFMGGGATLLPRMEGDFGYLLNGLMGNVVSTNANADIASNMALHAAIALNALGTASTGWTNPPSARNLAIFGDGTVTGTGTITVSGTDDNGAVVTESGINITSAEISTAPFLTVNIFKTITSVQVTAASTAGNIYVTYFKKSSHDFQFNATPTTLPWMSVRKYIPGTTPLWEQGYDNKVTSCRFTFPQNGVVSARVDFLGRTPDWTTPGSPTWAGDLEAFGSVPATCDLNGFIKLPNSYNGTTAFPITNLVITMVNNLTSPSQEMIIGSPYPDDFAVLSRAMSIQATLKWADPQLYLDILTGNVTGTSWAPGIFTSNLDVLINAPAVIPGNASATYSLEVLAGEVMWGVNGSPVLAGGDVVMLPLIGTVLNPSSGNYCDFILTNEQAHYAQLS